MTDEKLSEFVRELASSPSARRRWCARLLADLASGYLSPPVWARQMPAPGHLARRSSRCWVKLLSTLGWRLPPEESVGHVLARLVGAPLPMRRAAAHALVGTVLVARATEWGWVLAHAIPARVLLEPSRDYDLEFDLDTALHMFVHPMLAEYTTDQREFLQWVTPLLHSRVGSRHMELELEEPAYLRILRNAPVDRFDNPPLDPVLRRRISQKITRLARWILVGDGQRSWLAVYTAAYYYVKERWYADAGRNLRDLDRIWPAIPPDRQRAAVCGALTGCLRTLDDGLHALRCGVAHLERVLAGDGLQEARRELRWWVRLLQKSRY